MPFIQRRHVLNEILDGGVLPVFHHAEAAGAEQMARACSAGGARCPAFELRGSGDRSGFADLAARLRDAGSIILGAAGVADAATADAVIASGAAFICGTRFDESVARSCNRQRVAYVPICADAAEIRTAEELGAEIVALVAGSATNPDAVRPLLHASPRSQVMIFDRAAPAEDGLRAWFDAGAAAVAFGSDAFSDAPSIDGPEGIRGMVVSARRWARKARGQKLFQGVEHVGLYEHSGASAADITAWYRDTFEWEVEEGRAYYFAAGDGPGRIEIMKVGKTDRCHLAIKVADLEEATAYLKAKGIDLVPPETRPDGRRIFFTVTDPAGNILHLLP